MAVAGGACSAYRCRVEEDYLYAASTTTLRTLCVDVATAVERLSRGETVIVQGSDMAKLREELDKAFVR